MSKDNIQYLIKKTESVDVNNIILQSEDERRIGIIYKYVCDHVNTNGYYNWNMFMLKNRYIPSPMLIRFCEAEIESLIDTISNSDNIFYDSLFEYNEAFEENKDDPDELIRIFVRHLILNSLYEEYLRINNNMPTDYIETPSELLKYPYFSEMILLLSQLELCENINSYYYIISQNIDNRTGYLNKRNKMTTYQWQTNPDQDLPILYHRMNGKFIAEIDFPAFRAIFTGQQAKSINTKIEWLADSVLLAYFIDSIRNKLPINTDVWSVAKYCFQNADNLKQSQQNYQNNKSELPKQHHLIDNLLKDL